MGDDANQAKLAARHELWRRGSLFWKLDSTQKQIYELMEGKRRYFLLCSRRLGKSFMLTCLAFEYAIQHPDSYISYAAPTQKDATEIVSIIAKKILRDCPDDVMPTFDKTNKEYRFPNGSTVKFSGVNAEHHENLRGREAHLFICDEIANWTDLDYVLKSIINPMTATTLGRVLLASTPPRSPGHDMTKLAKRYIIDGNLVTFTIREAKHIDYDEKIRILVQDCGEDPEKVEAILNGTAEAVSTTAQREYFCKLDVTDADTAVLPEFTPTAQKEICFDHPRPQFFDSYTAVDYGSVDNTGCLFGYWDFHEKKLVIEAESLIKRPGTDDIANAVQEHEEALWGGKMPLIRVFDGPLITMTDFQTRYGLVFIPADRQDAQGAVDNLRSMIRRREIIISPNCTGLIRQMAHATWNRKASDFERTEEDAHFDLLAALKYMARKIVKSRNPFPQWWGRSAFGTFQAPSAAAKHKTVFTNTPLGKKLAKKWG